MSKYKGQLEGFPKHIVEAMLDEQEKQGNTRDVSLFESCKSRGKWSGGFHWADSKLGKEIWNNIITNRIFELFPLPKKIIGYIVPFDIQVGVKDIMWKNGEVAMPWLSSVRYYVNNKPGTLPKEIVEKWEPVYEKNEVVVQMGGKDGFPLKIVDGKVFHKNEDITTFVKDISERYSSIGNAGSYSYAIKDIIFSRTGCEDKETRLSEWIKVNNLLKD